VIIASRAPLRDTKGKVSALGYQVTFGQHRPDAPRPGFADAIRAMADAERARREVVTK
jgi:hypothetical protein